MNLITLYKILNSVLNFKMLTFILESKNYRYINKKIGIKIEKKINFSFLIFCLDSKKLTRRASFKYTNYKYEKKFKVKYKLN